MTRIALLLAALLTLSGCGSLDSLAELTGFGADCSAPAGSADCRASESAESGAPMSEAAARQAERRYCYRNIGGVFCYDRPDYSAGNTRLRFAEESAPSPAEPVPLAALPAPDLR